MSVRRFFFSLLTSTTNKKKKKNQDIDSPLSYKYIAEIYKLICVVDDHRHHQHFQTAKITQTHICTETNVRK